jgi:hypothetical protein
MIAKSIFGVFPANRQFWQGKTHVQTLCSNHHSDYAGKASDYSARTHAQVIDAQGGTILPGIIDAHVHGAPDPAIRRQFLMGGVTAVCDPGFPLEAMARFDQDHLGQDPVAIVADSAVAQGEGLGVVQATTVAAVSGFAVAAVVCRIATHRAVGDRQDTAAVRSPPGSPPGVLPCVIRIPRVIGVSDSLSRTAVFTCHSLSS